MEQTKSLWRKFDPERQDCSQTESKQAVGRVIAWCTFPVELSRALTATIYAYTTGWKGVERGSFFSFQEPQIFVLSNPTALMKEKLIKAGDSWLS